MDYNQSHQTLSLKPREFPLFKLSIALIIGISIQSLLSLSLILLQVLFGIVVLTFFVLHSQKSIGVLHTIRSTSIYLILAIIGSINYQYAVDNLRDDFLDEHMYKDVKAIVRCETTPKHSTLTQFEGVITHIQKNGSYEPIKPKGILVHLYENENDVRIGDSYFINDIIKNTSRSHSPKAFDYSRYLKYKHIAYQTYNSTNDIKLYKRKGKKWNEKLRSQAIQKFEKYLHYENVPIASALILGYRGFIDDELYDAFTETGSMHVLAVSGLHVGIVSMLLGFILGLIKSNYWVVKVFRCVFLLLGIWAFALITGGSPSVIRASIMFSIFEMNKIFFGHYNVFNSIGSAALIMLLMDPFVLFHVGFQLSFSAILSIVLFCGGLTKLLSFQNLIFQKVWSLFAVALSVQILTLPISLFYFHQFPLYFPITGVTAVVSATLILAIGLITLFFSFFIESHFIWIPLDYLVDMLRESTYMIQSWPGGLIANIPFDYFSVGGMYLVISFLSISFFWRNKFFLVLGLLLSIVLVSRNEMQSINQRSQNEIVEYDTRVPLVDVFIDGVVYCYADKKLTEKNISFASTNYRIHKRVNKVVYFRTKSQLKDFLRLNEDVLN